MPDGDHSEKTVSLLDWFGASFVSSRQARQSDISILTLPPRPRAAVPVTRSVIVCPDAENCMSSGEGCNLFGEAKSAEVSDSGLTS